MGRVALAAVAGALLLGATACGERSEPTGADAGLYPVTVQSGDRPLVVAHPATRIAALDKATEDIVGALGAGSRVVVHAPENRIDFAALKRAKPDLIVASQGADEHDLSRAGSLTHAQVYLAPGRLDPPGRARDHAARPAHRRPRRRPAARPAHRGSSAAWSTRGSPGSRT